MKDYKRKLSIRTKVKTRSVFWVKKKCSWDLLFVATFS